MPLKFILDTHMVLWHMTDDHRLARNVKAALMDPNSDPIIQSSGLVKTLW